MKRFKILIMILAASGFAGYLASSARGDIYAWTDENGVKHFTNYAPPKQAALFMKTPEIAHDEEVDNQRSEMDRLEVARLELAEREAFLREEQQAAERRIAAANARADAALQEADRILQDAQVATESDASYGPSSNGYGYYYPYYFYGPRYKKYDGGLYRKRYNPKHKIDHYGLGRPGKYTVKHPLHNRYGQERSATFQYSITYERNPYPTHRSRTTAFRGKHGLW